jgi:two-component system, OmpR family, response regulator
MPTRIVVGTDRNPNPPSFPDPPRPPDESAMSRVRRTARAISDRVRRALTPPGAEVAPLRVLVVDDHPDAADALAVILELLGCPVRACHDGRSALVTATEFDPQVCLLDLVMPGMDGLELAVRLKERAGNRPLMLVATTALGDAEARDRTAAAGFHAHLTKPVDAPTLVEALTQFSQLLADQQQPPGEPD